MKKQIITTIILLIATAAITVVYFKNLNPPGSNTSRIMAAIPDNASVIFQFTNEKSFYDIFNGNTLLESVTGKDQISDIDTVRDVLLNNPLIAKYFNGQSLFISLHPLKGNGADLLLTLSAGKGFDEERISKLSAEKNSGLIINPLNVQGAKGYSIYFNSIKKRFYVVDKGEGVFAGSFSEELAALSAQTGFKGDKHDFVLLSEQQNSNSLANLYVNYEQLTPLFSKLFVNNSDIFRSFKLLSAKAVLSMNYKSDALMFSGISTLQKRSISYLDIFADQQPVVSHLKDIFPATTAYSTNLSVSDPLKFGTDLYQYYAKAGIQKEEDSLFHKVKAEAGINLRTEFNNLLGNEFAIVTTRYEEKYAIVSVKDGSKLLPFMVNISNMITDNMGQFKYSKLPFFLLGDVFGILKKPYFMILDNYLILATSQKELNSYADTYLNRKFLIKTDAYNQFYDLLSERSNVAFFINFKNSQPILKRDVNPDVYNSFENNNPGWKNFYGASYQLSSADENFYTNFCIRLNNIDTSAVNSEFQ
ncbi:MAG: hypothetical protein ACHQF4_04595 [Sphingobacteriales bacterium]